MAHFRGTIEGDRGEVSRLGTKKSGLIATVNGWTTGVTVTIHYNEETGEDVVYIYRTDGSNSTGSRQFLRSWRVKV